MLSMCYSLNEIRGWKEKSLTPDINWNSKKKTFFSHSKFTHMPAILTLKNNHQNWKLCILTHH